MQTLRRHLLTAGAALLMPAVAGVATAEALTSNHHGARTDPSLRVYPSCPRHDRHVIRSTTTGADRMLVPTGARQVLLCRYNGTFTAGPGVGSIDPVPYFFSLTAQHLVTGRTRTEVLARELNALTPTTGAYSCPAENGSVIVAFFRYGATPRADDPVTIGLSGCLTATNGHLNRLAGLTTRGRRLVRQLKRLDKPLSRYDLIP